MFEFKNFYFCNSMKKTVTKEYMVKTLTRWKKQAKEKSLSKTGEGQKPPLTSVETLVLEVFQNPNLPDGVRVSDSQCRNFVHKINPN